MTTRPSRLHASLLSLALLVAAAAPVRAATPGAEPIPSGEGHALTCEQLPRLMATYLQNHVLFHAMTLELRDRVAESHLRLLDPGRSLLLEEDADSLRKVLAGVFPALSRDDCGILESMHRLSIERYREMESFVREYVSSDDYAIDPSATLVLDPEKRGFPKTAAEREDLYRRLVHFQMSNYVSNGEPLADAKQKLIHRHELITKRAEEMSKDEIYGRFLEAFAMSLDPHSEYLTADSLEDFKIHMGLSLEGIGAVLSSKDGYTVVEEVVPGGAAALAGSLKPKDKILSVGQAEGEMVDVIDMDLRDVVRMIRGKKGTAVRLAVLRQGATTERFTVRLLREKINLEEQAAKLRFESVERDGKPLKIAVLELPSFYGDKEPGARQATEDVKKLLDQARAEKADGLVLDLSRNGGGLLEYAVRISGFFLEQGGVVAVGESQEQNQVLADPDAGILWDGPLVVLTSRITASAAEILAGAVKDYRRGVIVGDDHTYGKGSVQTVAPLPPGLGALKLTTAMFFRPGGQSTQHSGVESDIVVPSLTAIPDFGEQYQHYSLPHRSIKPFEGATRPSAQGFTPVSEASMRQLSERSRERVASEQRFAEVEKEIAKQRENAGVVKVSELLEKKEEGDVGDEPGGSGAALTGDSAMIVPPGVPGEGKKKDEPSPQLLEAIEILADLVAQQPATASN